MQMNPSPQGSMEHESVKQNRKQEKAPYRTQINLKNRRRRNIPEIKIQLDEMLTQAFYQIQMQPKKNVRIGNTDLYVLDNDLLREYVTAVYDEYGIEDPLAKTQGYLGNMQKNRSSSNFGTRPTTFQTPQKSTNNKNINDSGVKISKRSNKTTERLSKLKKNFQNQLQTMPTTVVEDVAKTAQKKSQYEQMRVSRQSSQQKQPGKKLQLKVARRSSQRSSEYESRKKNQGGRYSHLLAKTKHKYCLMCQQPLDTDLINNHEKQCEQLQKLLNTPNLKIEQISSILDSKIAAIESELRVYHRSMSEDSHALNQIINSIIRQNPQQQAQEQDESEDNSSLIKAFSMLNTIKCMENIDKLQWFKKMKAKAEVKKKEDDFTK